MSTNVSKRTRHVEPGPIWELSVILTERWNFNPHDVHFAFGRGTSHRSREVYTYLFTLLILSLEHYPTMPAIFPCMICNTTFNDNKSLISHRHTQRHMKRAGESFEGPKCGLCGRQFSRVYDISRHQQQGGCPVATLRAMMPNKRKHNADHPAIPSPRVRTTSPTRKRDLSDETWHSDKSDRNTTPTSESERLEAEVTPTSQRLSHNTGDSSGTISNPLSQDAVDSDCAVNTDASALDVLDDTVHDDIIADMCRLPLTDIRACNNTAAWIPASPHNRGHLELSEPPANSNGDAISTTDATQVECLTRVLERTSIETKQRSSFCPSVATRSSIRSYLKNPSLRDRLSWHSGLSKRSSNRSHKRASTVPSEMAAPMLDLIDEELRNSRASGTRLEGHVPRRDERLKEVLQERLRIAVKAGVTEEVVSVLLSGAGIIDVNYPDDSGQTPLIVASIYGHTRIVAVLLDQSSIDVGYREPKCLFAASIYAHRTENTEIQEMLNEAIDWEC
jgi:hypothetical protein